MDDTIFTKIIRRDIWAEIIYEDDVCIVIPDKFPSMHGQTLVILKRQTPYIFDVSQSEYAALMDVTRKIASALDRAFSTVRTCVVIEGFEVPHIHVRLYPCTTEELVWSPRVEASDSYLKEISEQIKNSIR